MFLYDWATIVQHTHFNLQFLLLLVDLCDSLSEHGGWRHDPQWAHLQHFNAGLTESGKKKKKKVDNDDWFNCMERDASFFPCRSYRGRFHGPPPCCLAWKSPMKDYCITIINSFILPSHSPCCCSLYPTPPLRRQGSCLQSLWWSTADAAPAATGSWGSPCYVGAFL